MLGFIKALFGVVKSLLDKAFAISKENGLTDEIVDLALKWVKVAAEKTIESDAKRKWVVDVLVGKGIPRSIANLAVELAYQLYLKEIKDRLAE